MNKPVLGFDIDGVLYKWQEQAYQYLKTYNGYTGSYGELFTTSDFLDKKGLLFQENLVRLENLYSTRPATKEDIEVMNRLAQKYDIVYITNRPKGMEDVTTNYLKRCGFPFWNNVIFTNDKKLDVRLQGCKYFIEDRVDNIKNLLDVTTVIVFKQPWNYDFCNNYSLTICSLKELEELL